MKNDIYDFDPKFGRLLCHSVRFLIKFGCCVAFVAIAFYQVQKHSQNEDATIFSVKPFKGMGWDVFPAITICFANGEYAVSEGLFNSTSIRSELNLILQFVLLKKN